MQPGTDVASTARPVKQGRPGVIVLIAFVVELVAIGALANQVVVKHLQTFVATHHDRFVGHLVAAFLTYQWRISAQSGDRANEPLAHACLDLVVLALTALLVLAVCRGPVTFVRAFFGTWMAVVVATLVGQVIFDFISPPPYPTGFGHASGAVFTGPDGFGFIGGLLLGVVTAIFAAIFAVATRRTVRPAAYPEPARREEYGGQDWSDQTVAYPRQDYPPEYGQPYPEQSREPYGGGYYGGQVGAATAAAAAAPTVAPAAGAAGGAAESTQQLHTVPAEPPAAAPAEPPAAAPAEPPAAAPAEEQSVEDHRDVPTEAMAPPEPPTTSTAESAGDETRQFPRPPDDEDLGQHPEHHEL